MNLTVIPIYGCGVIVAYWQEDRVNRCTLYLVEGSKAQGSSHYVVLIVPWDETNW